MRTVALFAVLAALAGDWPAWRGPTGSGTSDEAQAPLTWDAAKNVRWKTPLPGEGASAPILANGCIYLTAALDRGERRLVLALDAATGKLLWKHETVDNNPERSSALTGHAAATPVTDGTRIVAVQGNAGVVCLDRSGKLLWRTPLPEFDSELGLASSPVLHAGRVYLVCDHDGDSYLLALDAATGKVAWKQPRPEVGRGWATPLLFPVGARQELLVATDGELRAHDPASGKLLWTVPGLGKWVAPSPIRAGARVIAASGKNGPVLCVEPGQVEGKRLLWKRDTGGPYICSPVVWGDLLYLPHETGIFQCVDLATGKDVYRERVSANKFLASPLAVAGRLYWPDEEGVTHVIEAGPKFRVLARNPLGEEVRAAPVLLDGVLYLRGAKHLFAIAE